MSVDLTIDDLFTPAPSGIDTSGTGAAPAAGSWLEKLLLIASIVQLPTTSWQEGAPERSILSIAAVAYAQDDALISKMAQGGFGQFAADGTVPVVNTDGTTSIAFVTPDPSIPSQNPTGAPGWLDAWGGSMFNEDRLQASAAAGPLAVVNTSNGSIGPYAPGSYHVANAATKATYANAASLTVPPSLIAGAGGTVAGVTVGLTTIVTTSGAHGLGIGDVVFFGGVGGVTGINGKFGQVTAATTNTFTLQLATAGAWTSGGSVYKCTVGAFLADLMGTASNAGPGAVTTTVTQASGVSVSNLTAWSASNYESNDAYRDRCLLKWGSISPNGASGAYDFLALSAQAILAKQSPAVALTNGPIDRSITAGNPVDGTVLVTIASSTSASSVAGQAVTPGCAQLAITGATNSIPIVIATAAPHNMNSGDTATVSGVLGNGAANGTYPIVVVDPTHFSLTGTSGSGTYTANTGSVEGGDLGQVDRLLQQKAVPSGQREITQSALVFPVAVVATVIVPASKVAQFQIDGPAAVAAYIKSLPVGGLILPGAVGGVVPYEEVSGALNGAGILTPGALSYVTDIQSLTVNGATSDVALTSPQYRPILTAITINVVGA